jgi:hypothetical protein
LLAVALSAATASLARPASAAPVWNTGLDTGVCGSGSALALSQLGWCNALRGDVLFLRDNPRQFGLGPALRIGTARFDDFRLDAGLALLGPLFESFPLVLEAGPHLRNLHQPGAYASAFFGMRNFNYYGHYEIAAGLALTAERSFSHGTPSALWITARIDGAWIALPAIFLYNALK